MKIDRELDKTLVTETEIVGQYLQVQNSGTIQGFQITGYCCKKK